MAAPRQALLDGPSATLLGDASRADELLVVLPGALLDGPNAALARLAARRPVLLVTYGRVRRMDALVDAIAALIAGHGRASADVLGSSFGGWVAQCLVRRHPDRVRRLVLAHTFALRPADAVKFRVALALWAAGPRPFLAGLCALRARRVLAPVRRRSEAIYASALAEVHASLRSPGGLDALVGQSACMLDSLVAPGAPEGDPSPSERRRLVLLVESGDDPVVPPAARAYLRSRYPAAVVHRFPDTGHVSALAEPAAFADLVERFLA